MKPGKDTPLPQKLRAFGQNQPTKATEKGEFFGLETVEQDHGGQLTANWCRTRGAVHQIQAVLRILVN